MKPTRPAPPAVPVAGGISPQLSHFTDRKLHFSLKNIQSIKYKSVLICELVCDTVSDIIVLTETLHN